MSQEFKQHLTSKDDLFLHMPMSYHVPLSDADLAMGPWSLFEKEETRKRLTTCPHSCCLHVKLVLCETIELLLRI